MKTFFIESLHFVNIDDYNEGEQNQVNCYEQKATIKAENPREAIKQYFETQLYFSFDIEKAAIEHEEEGEEAENLNKLNYSNLVDEENSEANEKEIEEWKQGKKVLYSNTTIISIFEVKPIKI
jgi:hypothetical protein